MIIFDTYTKGVNKNNKILTGNRNSSARFSELCNAIILGKISPKISITTETIKTSNNIAEELSPK